MEGGDTTEVTGAPTTRSNTSRAERAFKPTTRFSQETSDQTSDRTSGTNGESRRVIPEASSNNDGKPSNTSDQLSLILQLLQNQAKVVEQQGRMIEQQGRMIEQQGKMIEEQGRRLEGHMKDTKAQFAAINERVDHMNDRFVAIDQQLLALNERLNALVNAGTPLGINGAAPLSYAGVLRSNLKSSPAGTTSQGTPVTNICSMNPSSSASQQGAAASPSISIDFSGSESTTYRTDKPGAVRRRIDDALAGQEATGDIKCGGISRNPKDANKFKVFFGDEGQVQTVRQHNEWLTTRFPGAKLLAEQWYPVRIDGVYKFAVLNDSHSTKVKEEAVKQVGDENGVAIHKIQWLSKPNSDKTYGSMVMYLARREDAIKLLQRGMVDIEGETAFARRYERRVGPVRCYKCHQFNHIAARCPSPVDVCGRCAESGHTARDCTSTTTKCVTCGGHHSTYDRNCRIYRMEKEKYATHHHE